jgi:hypothetical protein
MIPDIPCLKFFENKKYWVDKWGFEYFHNSHGFRTEEFSTVDHNKLKFLTFGGSDVMGACNHQQDSWPEVLKKMLNMQGFNLGQGACSIDYVARIMPNSLEYFKPDAVFILYPPYVRFEYYKDGNWYNSLPHDRDRIYFMETATDEWLENNFKEKVNLITNLCKRTKLVSLILDDLVPYIDHADRWTMAPDGQHGDAEWNKSVAKIFFDLYQEL